MRFNDIIEAYRANVVLDEYGQHRDWNNPKLVLSTSASILPSWSKETLDTDRDISEIQVHVYCRPVDIRATDRIRVTSGSKLFFKSPFLSPGINASPPGWYEVYGTPIIWAGRTVKYMRITARQVKTGG